MPRSANRPGIETPNTKLQTPEKLQVPSSKRGPRFGGWHLEFGTWDFFGVWCLVFGALRSVSPRLDQSGQTVVKGRRIRQVLASTGARHQTKAIAISRAVDDARVGAVPGDLPLCHFNDMGSVSVEFVFPAHQARSRKPVPQRADNFRC